MTKRVGDIYGQIDALLGKRSAEILNDRSNATDDFPMLTEVISSQKGEQLRQKERRQGNPLLDGRRVADRRAAPRRASDVPGSVTKSSESIELILAATEKKVVALLQQKNAETLQGLRKIIRDEVERILGDAHR